MGVVEDAAGFFALVPGGRESGFARKGVRFSSVVLVVGVAVGVVDVGG